ncbi:MAG TPA: ClbS/DfsB family four-helix bundle protein [Chloroflexia bacterium]|nr:ClbS/DfsB family four-helix bundle protein [Chloroflexia bacterium]
MDAGTTKAELLGILAAEHAAWRALLDAIGEDRMLLPGAAGPGWTVKDVTAHLTAWRERSCARLQAGLQHTAPAPPPWPAELDENAPGGVAQINAWFEQAARDRPLAAVLQESEAAWQQLADLVRALPEADLLEAGRFAWLGGAPLAAVLHASLAHLHEHIHMLAIQGWLAARSRTA